MVNYLLDSNTLLNY